MTRSDHKKLVSTIYLIICLFPKTAYCLDWDSKEWLENSCKKSIFGTWVPESHSNLAFAKLKIDEKSINIIKKNNKGIRLIHDGIKDLNRWKHVEIESQSLDSKISYPRYMKARPHLIRKLNLPEKREEKADCLIKIFRFKSKLDMKKDKYSNWDIYRQIPGK